MKIEFRKIGYEKKPFEIENDSLLFSGDFSKKSNSIVNIDLSIKGKLSHSCDGCADDMMLELDEDISLLVSDGVYDGDEIDIYETFDHFVDFDKICESELESYKGNYHYCEKCINKFKE